MHKYCMFNNLLWWIIKTEPIFDYNNQLIKVNYDYTLKKIAIIVIKNIVLANSAMTTCEYKQHLDLYVVYIECINTVIFWIYFRYTFKPE